jgi:hypothetical protein
MKKYKNEIEKDSKGWIAFAFAPEAAALLNRRLKVYDQAALEQHTSEGIFRFEEKDLPFVRAVLVKWGGLE